MIDIDAAREFVAIHGRLLDRRRFAHLVDGAPAEGVLRALAGYRNDDGGFGHALEPDVRAANSEPIAVLAAFDILRHCDAAGHPWVTGALDWLATVTNDDGGVPFLLPGSAGAPRAPFLNPAEGAPSSLHMTSAVAGAALKLAEHERSLHEHPWLTGATEFCWSRLPLADTAHAYETRFVLDFLDGVPDRARADEMIDAIAARLPPDGRLRVSGGTEGEALNPIGIAPWPGRPIRRILDEAVVEAGLDELAAGQRDDGGWDFDWLAWNPAVAWEWRGRLTVDWLTVLKANGVRPDASRLTS